MADGNLHPSVFVVDSYATGPPLPPRLGQTRQRAGAAQTLLFLLVSLALCGMTIQACLLYRLYQSEPADSASFAKLISGGDVPTKATSLDVLPFKPAAHLTDGHDVVHESKIMAWSRAADPLLHEMDYSGTKLVVEKEGYYFVYSKVYFSVETAFMHSVHVVTKRYLGKSIPLMEARKYSKNTNKVARSNSYLGGVFHLYQDDALFVQVSDTAQIVRSKPNENFFGAYMI